MLVLIGASASGKTELAKRLIANHGFVKTITYTTRPKRAREVDGVDYHFIADDAFLAKQSEGQFLETTEYHGYRYGTAFNDALPHRVVIVDIDGANAILDAMPEGVVVVYVDTDKAVRKRRMLSRGDAEADVESRLAIDDASFNPTRLKRVDHIASNNQEKLADLASDIAMFYHDKLGL